MIPFKQIKVTDKNGVKLAIFDNAKVYKSKEAMINTLAEPIIHMESGKIATLSFSILSKSSKWNLVNNPENLWYCENRVFTMLEENSVSYEGDLAKVVLYERANLLKREYAQIHNVDTNIESLDIHTIKILPRTSGSLKLTIRGVQYSDSVVKDSRGVLMPRGSAGYALWALLKASKRGWSLGICDMIASNFDASKDIGSFNLESDQEDLFTNIEHVVELWGGILVIDSLNKIIHLRNEELTTSDFNTWNGYFAREGKNLLEKPQIQVDNNIITKAYIIGNGGLSIKQVNNDKEYVENYSYTTDVYEGYLRNENIHYTGSNSTSGQSQLLEWGKKELAYYSKPRKVYLFSILNRNMEEDYAHEEFDINTIVKIYFTDSETNKLVSETQRIIDIQYDVFNSAECSVMAGDKILNKVDIFELMYDNSVGSSILPDWSGYFNAFDIMIDIPDSWSEWYSGFGSGGGSIHTSQLFEIYVEKITENTEATAGLRLYADETFSTIETFTTFKKQTEDGFSESWTTINQTSDDLHAQITLEANHYSELNGKITESIAGLKVYADSQFATVESFTSFQNKTSTSISQLSNSLGSQITLEANHYNELSGDIDSANKSIANLKLEVKDDYATIEALAQTDKAVASIKITADGNTSKIEALADDVDILGKDSVRMGTDYNYLYIQPNSVRLGKSSYSYLSFFNNRGELFTSGEMRIASSQVLTLQGESRLNIISDVLYIKGRNANWRYVTGIGNVLTS